MSNCSQRCTVVVGRRFRVFGGRGRKTTSVRMRQSRATDTNSSSPRSRQKFCRASRACDMECDIRRTVGIRRIIRNINRKPKKKVQTERTWKKGSADTPTKLRVQHFAQGLSRFTFAHNPVCSRLSNPRTQFQRTRSLLPLSCSINTNNNFYHNHAGKMALLYPP
jgi:hypothetical protein